MKRFILIAVTELTLLSIAYSNKWPTFIKTSNHFQDCYLCPPGYYMIKECPTSRNTEPGYSECKECADGQYTDSWNRSPRCWDHDKCYNNEVEICQHGTIGKTECGCSGKTHKENGVCVQSISREDHKWELEKKDEACKSQIAKIKTPSCPTISTTPCIVATCPPCPTTSKNVISESAGAAICPLCPACSCVVYVIVTIIVVIIIEILIFIIWKKYCNKGKRNILGKNDARNSENKKHDDRNGNNRQDLESGQLPDAPANAEPDEVRMQDENEHNEARDAQPKPKTQVVELNKKGQGDVPVAPNIENDREIDAKAEPIPPNQDDKWEKVIRICEKEVLSSELESFFRDILQLDSKFRIEIFGLKDNREATIRKGLRKYQNHRESSIENLLQKLRKEDCNKLADEIVENVGINDVKREPYKENPLDKAFAQVEKLLSSDRALEFFRSELRLTDKQLDNLKSGNQKTIILEGLRMWKNREGNEATPEALVSHLKNEGLSGVAHVIEDTVLKPGNSEQGEVRTDISIPAEQPESSAVGNKAGPIYEPNTTPEGVVPEIDQQVNQPSASTTSGVVSHPSSEGQSRSPIPVSDDIPAGSHPAFLSHCNADDNPMQQGQLRRPVSAFRADTTSPSAFSSITSTSHDANQNQADDKGGDDGRVITDIDNVNEGPNKGGKAAPDSEDRNEQETEPKKLLQRRNDEDSSQPNSKPISSFTDDEKVKMKDAGSISKNHSETRNGSETKPKEVWTSEENSSRPSFKAISSFTDEDKGKKMKQADFINLNNSETGNVYETKPKEVWTSEENQITPQAMTKVISPTDDVYEDEGEMKHLISGKTSPNSKASNTERTSLNKIKPIVNTEEISFVDFDNIDDEKSELLPDKKL